MQPVVGSISRLMTRYLYSATDSGKSWDSPVDLLARPEVLQDLHFWENNINSLNVKNFSSTCPPPPSILSFSDASSTGCGTILSLDNVIKIGYLIEIKKFDMEGIDSCSSGFGFV